MYIFELIYKLTHKKQLETIHTEKKTKSDKIEGDEEEKCEHIFIPIDSTKKTLACSKCGYVLKVEDEPKHKKNFFIKE